MVTPAFFACAILKQNLTTKQRTLINSIYIGMLKLQLLSYGYFVLHSLSYNRIYLATSPLAFGNADDGLLLAAVCGRCRETASMSGLEDFTLKFSELKQILNFTSNNLHLFGPV